MKHFALSAVALCLNTTLVFAMERDLDSHVHGGAGLNIAIDGNSLFMEFQSPWANLVGFEHEPSTDAQHEAVEVAMAQLNETEQLFGFTGTACKLHEMHIESEMGEAHHEEEHAEEHEHEGAEHSSVSVSYEFDCDDASQLNSISVKLFDVWTGISDIDVQLIGPSGQMLNELAPDNAEIDVSSVL